jgi:ABC-type antimicrobial peptide transport system permease subunit
VYYALDAMLKLYFIFISIQGIIYSMYDLIQQFFEVNMIPPSYMRKLKLKEAK